MQKFACAFLRGARTYISCVYLAIRDNIALYHRKGVRNSYAKHACRNIMRGDKYPIFQSYWLRALPGIARSLALSRRTMLLSEFISSARFVRKETENARRQVNASRENRQTLISLFDPFGFPTNLIKSSFEVTFKIGHHSSSNFVCKQLRSPLWNGTLTGLTSRCTSFTDG